MDDLKVYMNTWKNYNEYGADLEAYGIKDGWMDIDQALEFCEKYANDEPFINDVDNPTGFDLEISEYDNPVQVLKGLQILQGIASETGNDADTISDLFEAWSIYDGTDSISEESMEEFKDFVDTGDYRIWPGVHNDYDLGYAIIEEFGTEGITNPDYYVDWDEIKEALQDDVNSQYDEDDEDWYEVDDSEVEDFINYATPEQLSNYFDYEKLGRDISIESNVTYASNGNCIEIY